MERNKLLNLSPELQKPLLEQKKQLIEKYEEYSKQQNRAREELRRNQRDYETAKERYARDLAAGKEDAHIDEDHYKEQISSSQDQLNDATKKRDALQSFFETLKSKGFKGAYDLVKSDTELTREAPILLNWIDAVDPIMKKDFNSKAKLIGATTGLASAGAAIFAWLHSNPPSLYAKEIGEAQASISDLPDETVGKVKESLNKLSAATTETEKDILQSPEKAQEFIATLAQTKQDIDHTVAVLKKQPEQQAKRARKELADVSNIIGSRLKTLGGAVGVDTSDYNQETGAANAVKTQHTGNSDNIKKIQAYLGRKVDPRVIETGIVDRDTERALTTLEARISQKTGKDVTGLLLKNGKVMQYDDFMRLMSVVFK